MTDSDLEAELRLALGNDLPYELEFLEPPNGGTIASIDSPLYDLCQRFLDERDPGATLLPVLSVGFTDSHYLRQSFGTVAYGFWPSRHTPEEVRATGFHNKDERLHVDDLGYAAAFHVEICRRVGAL